MNDMQKELAGHGIDVTFVAINAEGAETDQSALSNQGDFPMLQDTLDTAMWTELGGSKDDFYLYSSDGTLAAHLPASGTVTLDLGGKTGYGNLRAAAAALK